MSSALLEQCVAWVGGGAPPFPLHSGGVESVELFKVWEQGCGAEVKF